MLTMVTLLLPPADGNQQINQTFGLNLFALIFNQKLLEIHSEVLCDGPLILSVGSTRMLSHLDQSRRDSSYKRKIRAHPKEISVYLIHRCFFIISTFSNFLSQFIPSDVTSLFSIFALICSF